MLVLVVCLLVLVVLLFVFITQANGNVASLSHPGFIENPSSCHYMNFKYGIFGSNPGSLRVYLQTQSGDVVEELWGTSESTTGWVSVSLNFRYYGRFRVSRKSCFVSLVIFFVI
jgi:hypothetical protein